MFFLPHIVPSIPHGAVNLDLFDESNGAYNSIAILEVSATTSLAMPEALHAGPQKRARGNGRIRSKAEVAPDRRQQGGATLRRVFPFSGSHFFFHSAAFCGLPHDW
jgi:hypothetical protein